MITELVERGCEGRVDPGLGLAARPQPFDYSWTGLGKFSAAAIDALELGDFHLVVHDIGGPIGFEIAAAMPERIKSLTILNTVIEVEQFHRPWMMKPFARRGVGVGPMSGMEQAYELESTRLLPSLRHRSLDLWHAPLCGLRLYV